jgi:chaperonin GroEL
MAFDRVGNDGSITIEESNSIETSLDITEGFSFASGYCASAFVTDERRAAMHHSEPMVLVTDHRISNVDQILPVLEIAAREGRPLVIVSEDIEGQALAALIMNAVRGTMKVAAIKAPGYGNERRDLLKDLAISVGAKFVSRENGDKLQETKMNHFGSAKFVESSSSSTIFVGGNADVEVIEMRIESLKSEMENIESLNECNHLQQTNN